MTAMVRFRAGGASYAVPVRDVRLVRLADGLTPLPAGRAGVAGLASVAGAALPVLSALGADAGQLLVLEAEGRAFGLLVEEVSGVVDLDDQTVGAAPEGQAGMLVTGVAELAGELVLIVDAATIARSALDG
jgi:chemotaxis signal transduction protein